MTVRFSPDCRTCQYVTAEALNVAYLKYSWMLWYAVVIHIIWGVTVIANPSVMHITAISSLGGSQYITAAIMLGAAICAALGMIFEPENATTMRRIMFCIPQQIVLFAAASSSLDAVIRGHYADGTVRPWLFILADQSPAIVAAILHTIAVAEPYWRPLWTHGK